MLPKPRVGLVLLRAEWFDAVVASQELVEAVTRDAQAMAARLVQLFELAGPWVVNSQESLLRVEKVLRAAEVDLFILAFQVWAEDVYLSPLLEAIGHRPLLVWCYVPWERPPRPASFVDMLRGSGPVGTLEGLGVIRNLGVDFAFTFGSPDDPRVQADLAGAARAARTRTELRSAQFGLLPYRNDQMQTTFVDEFRLRVELGPTLHYLSVNELKRTADALPEGEVEGYLAGLRLEFPIRQVSDGTLGLAARVSLALAHLAADRGLHLLSLNDIAPELHDLIGLRPCLYPPLLREANLLIGLEGDLGAATAMFILNRLTGSPVLFCEPWFWDEKENVIVAGHAGPQDPAIARGGSAWISHDFEFARTDRTEGAHLQFVARPGRVTLLQLRAKSPSPAAPQMGWQAILMQGEALESEPWVEGYPHAVIRLDAPIERFYREIAKAGSTQHWAMVYGDALNDAIAVCNLLGVRHLALP